MTINTKATLFCLVGFIGLILASQTLTALNRPSGVNSQAKYLSKAQVWVLDQNNVRQVWYKNGTLKAKGQYIQNKREKQWVFYHTTGKKKAMGSFQAGLRHGNWQFFDKSGKQTSEGSYQNNTKNGKWIYQYPSGKKQLQGNYSQGLRIGKWTNYYASSKVFYQGHYENNQPHGKWQYYFKDGTLQQQGAMVRGRRVGAWQVCIQPKGPCGTETYANPKSPRLSRLQLKIPKKIQSTKNPAALLDSLDSGPVPDKAPKGLEKSNWGNR
jgi:antitoxin component YwqK of YwqJK toxin-antitoxin module